MSNQSKPAPSPLRLIGGTLIGSVIIGGVVALAGQITYLIILFPLLMGGVGGVIAAGNVVRFGVQKRWVATLIGAGLGMLIYGSYRYSDYLLFLGHTHGNTPLQFIDYLRLVAAFGTTVQAGTSALRLPLGETLTWIYWIFEICLVVGVSGYIASIPARAVSKPAHGAIQPEIAQEVDHPI